MRNRFTLMTLSMILSLTFWLTSCSESTSYSQISSQDLAYLIEAGPTPVILDARSEQEFREGRVPGARRINHESPTLSKQLSRFKQQTIVVYCKEGLRSAIALEKLLGSGFKDVRHLRGDYRTWLKEGRPTERD